MLTRTSRTALTAKPKRLATSKEKTKQISFDFKLESSEEKIKLNAMKIQLEEAKSRCKTNEELNRALLQTQKELQQCKEHNKELMKEVEKQL